MWCSVQDVADSNIGLTYSPSDLSEKGIPVLRSNNIQKSHLFFKNVVKVSCQISNKQYLNNGDLLICARNGSRALVGKCALVEGLTEPTSFGAFMAVCRSICNPWISLVLRSQYFNEYLDNSNSTAINQVTQKMFLTFQIPLPPLNEQNRLYGYIDDLFKTIERIDELKDSVHELAKSVQERILDLAIHGKLVPQDPSDEPAIELFKRINFITIMAEKKTTKKAAAPKAEEPKKAAVKKAAAPKKAVKAAFTVNAENAGFKAGDVYQALAAAEKALTVKEIAKAAKISEEETLLGLGWLFKEGKLAAADEKITLA